MSQALGLPSDFVGPPAPGEFFAAAYDLEPGIYTLPAGIYAPGGGFLERGGNPFSFAPNAPMLSFGSSASSSPTFHTQTGKRPEMGLLALGLVALVGVYLWRRT